MCAPHQFPVLYGSGYQVLCVLPCSASQVWSVAEPFARTCRLWLYLLWKNVSESSSQAILNWVILVHLLDVNSLSTSRFANISSPSLGIGLSLSAGHAFNAQMVSIRTKSNFYVFLLLPVLLLFDPRKPARPSAAKPFLHLLRGVL